MSRMPNQKKIKQGKQIHCWSLLPASDVYSTLPRNPIFNLSISHSATHLTFVQTFSTMCKSPTLHSFSFYSLFVTSNPNFWRKQKPSNRKYLILLIWKNISLPRSSPIYLPSVELQVNIHLFILRTVSHIVYVFWTPFNSLILQYLAT